MYQYSSGQLEFKNFSQPFTKALRRDNRWVKMAEFMPWGALESIYAESLSGSHRDCPALPARMAIGALIMKERLGQSDEETVEQIRENPYLQYVIGLKADQDKVPFDASLFVHFRKRFGQEKIAQINEISVKKAMEATQNILTKKVGKEENKSHASEPKNKGKRLMDATCTPADITYPTDFKLLNQAREKTEKMIDMLHAPNKGKQKKPRTHRKIARQEFISIAKSKQISKKKRRKFIRKQLGYLRQNLKIIKTWPGKTASNILNHRQYKDLAVIEILFQQQKWMFKH